MVLDFAELDSRDAYKNIQKYFEEQEALGKDPRQASLRQKFNDEVFTRTDSRYLVGRYAENRYSMLRGSHIADEGRTYHLAIDVFARKQEAVFAPCDGEIVRSAYEPGLHNFGNYLVLRPDGRGLPYMFFGHLAADKLPVGKVRAGQQIGRLGSFANEENGGWSVHLHLQLLRDLPDEGITPIGYSTKQDLEVNQIKFPNPQDIFTEWKIRR